MLSGLPIADGDKVVAFFLKRALNGEAFRTGGDAWFGEWRVRSLPLLGTFDEGSALRIRDSAVCRVTLASFEIDLTPTSREKINQLAGDLTVCSRTDQINTLFHHAYRRGDLTVWGEADADRFLREIDAQERANIGMDPARAHALYPSPHDQGRVEASMPTELGGAFIRRDVWDSLVEELEVTAGDANIHDHQYEVGAGWALTQLKRLPKRFGRAPKGLGRLVAEYVAITRYMSRNGRIWYPSQTSSQETNWQEAARVSARFSQIAMQLAQAHPPRQDEES